MRFIHSKQTLSLLVKVVAVLVFHANGAEKVQGQPLLPIIPGQPVGMGMETVAGSGRHLEPPHTTIIQVTNLNPEGPGSLKAALEAEVPRTVVFTVSGAIRLTEMPRIEHPYITVAGQTAPSPGVSVHGAGIYVLTHDVLIQHLRIRAGDDPIGPPPVSRDALTIYNPSTTASEVYNVVIDHCSLTWAVDENLNTWSEYRHGVERVTVRHCLIAEALDSPLHPEGGHSRGFLIGKDDKDILVYGNLFAHNANRNPVVSIRSRTLIANNYIYNPQSASIHFYTGAPLYATVVGNVLKVGPDTNDHVAGSHWAVHIPHFGSDGPVHPDSEIYVEDNRSDNEVTGETTNSVLNDSGDSLIAEIPPLEISGLSIRSSDEVSEWVLENAGSRPLDRDATDARIVQSVIDGRGKIIEWVGAVGGWPTVAEHTHTLQVPANPNADDNGDGYTNLEEYLHLMATKIEPSAESETAAWQIK